MLCKGVTVLSSGIFSGNVLPHFITFWCLSLKGSLGCVGYFMIS